ncbi:MAG: hypothetical protein AAGA48_06230 [Myxococcota bacterium]
MRSLMSVRGLALLFAFLGPFLLWGGIYTGLMAYQDEEQAMAAANAGRVLNARVFERDTAATIDRILSEKRPRVLVLGPSYAHTNVRPAVLAARLGLPPSDVALISVPNSMGAHWYAILKYRVFDPGYRPDLVLMVTGLQSMLLTRPLSESSFVNLQVQLPPKGDPLIDAKVRGGASLWWATLREQRGKVRGAFFDRIRDGAVFWASPQDARQALGRVFNDEKIDMRLYNHAMPVVESGSEPAFTPDLLPSPEEGFLGDISALGDAHGAQVAWVRPPMSPTISAERNDVAPEGFQARALAVVSQQGGAYVDLRHLRMAPSMFRNEDHMNSEGSRRFSTALARVVRERGWLGTPDWDPWPVTVEGDAALAPGEGLTIEAATPWADDRGSFAVWLAAESEGATADPPFSLHLDGVPLPVNRGRAIPQHGSTWQQWRVGGSRPASPGPGTIVLRADSSGPGVRVQALALGDPPRQYVLGDAERLWGVRADVLARSPPDEWGPSVELVAAAPPVVPDAERPLDNRPGAVAALRVPQMAFLSDEVLEASTRWSERCSPLRIVEDGKPLNDANVPCEAVASGPGRSCHTAESIQFSASDGSDPARNGRRYELRLAESRACGGELFVYPQDTLRFTVAASFLAPLTRGVRVLTLAGRPLQRRAGELVVRLHAGSRLVFERRIDGRTFHRGDIFLRFEGVFPSDEPWTIELENLSATFYLLRGVTLSERLLNKP